MSGQRLPVTVITGFLGAGKTTLIRRLLSAPHGLRIGLVLNEIGQAGIDQVPEAEQAYVELTEGCACCIRNPDLIAALQEIAGRRDLDRVILETSGLADPLPLTWTISHPELAGLLELDAVVAVVDPLHHDQAPAEEWENQVRCADLVVIAKQDLAGAGRVDEVRAAVRRINSHARLLDGREEQLAELVLDVDIDEPRAASLEAAARRHSDFKGVYLAGPASYDQNRLEDLLESLPASVFRAKGIVPVSDGTWTSFHVVGGRAQVQLNAPPPAHGEGRIALFGRALVEADAREWLARCQS